MDSGSVNVTVVKSDNESVPSLIRRFSKRVQGSGIIRKVKNVRFYQRNVSKNKRRASALRRLEKAEKREEMARMGLVQPRGRGRK